MGKTEMIIESMRTIEELAEELREEEAVGMLVGVLAIYVRRNNLDPEKIVDTFLFTFYELKRKRNQ